MRKLDTFDAVVDSLCLAQEQHPGGFESWEAAYWLGRLEDAYLTDTQKASA